MKLPFLSLTWTALGRSWRLASHTPVAIVAAVVAAAAWTATIVAVGNVDAAADAIVIVEFSILCLVTAGAAATVTALSAARMPGLQASGSTRLAIARRAAAAAFTTLLLGVVGIVLAGLVHSFFIALFLGTCFFLYAVPMVAAGERHVLGGIETSVRLALHRPGPAVLAAMLVGLTAGVALAVSYALSQVPYIGIFIQSLLIQYACGFCAVFALEQFAALRSEGEVSSLKPRVWPKTLRSAEGRSVRDAG